MKKIFYITQLFILIICLAACGKKNGSGSYCYRCTIVGISGSRTLDTCSKVPDTQYSFRDANGNDQSFICNEK